MIEVEQLSLDAPSASEFNDSKNWTGRFRIKSVTSCDEDGNGTMDEKALKAEALRRFKP